MATLIANTNLRGTLNEGININQGRDFSDIGAGNVYGYCFIDNKDFLNLSFSSGQFFLSRGHVFVKYNKVGEPFTSDPSKELHRMKCELTTNSTGFTLSGTQYIYIQIQSGLTNIGSNQIDGSDYFTIEASSTMPIVGPHIGLLYQIDATTGTIIEDYRKYRDIKVESIDAEGDVNIGGDANIDGNADVAGDVNIDGDTVVGGSITTTNIILPGGDIQDQIDEIYTEGVPSDSIVDSNTFILGEDVVSGDSLFVEDIVTFASSTNVQNIGDTSANTRVSIPIIGSGIPGNILNLSLRRFTLPSVDLGLRIESDLGGSPSGTLYQNGSASITSTSLTTSLVDTTIQLLTPQNSNQHLQPLTITSSKNYDFMGVKFTLTDDVTVVNVQKVSTSTATTAYLYNSLGVLLQQSSFTGNIAVFNYQGLTNGSTYYVCTGSGGTTYTTVKQTGTNTFPYIGSTLNFVGGTSINNAFSGNEGHGFTTTGSSGGTGRFGVRIQALKDITINSVAIFGGATRAYIVTDTGNTVIQTAVVTLGIATFTPYTLTKGSYIRIEADALGASYTLGNYTTGPFPVNRQNISYIDGSLNGGPSGAFGLKNIFTVNSTSSIEIIDDSNLHNIEIITSADTVLIPKGDKAHIVLFAGSYGGETINPVNYFGVGYSSQHTTTRGLKSYNGSTRSIMQNSIFAYTSGVFFLNKLLSKTDADYTYKLPTEIVRIATIDGYVGDMIVCTVFGISDDFSGLVPGSTYYIANMPGGISISSGTNSYKIGKAITETKLFISSLPVL